MENKTITYKPKIIWKFKKAYLDVVANELEKILRNNGIEDYKVGHRDTFYMQTNNYPGDVHICDKDNPDNRVYSFNSGRIFTKEKYPLPKRDVLGNLAINLTDYIFGEGMYIKDIIKEHNWKKNLRITHLRKLDEVMNEIVTEINDKEIINKYLDTNERRYK